LAAGTLEELAAFCADWTHGVGRVGCRVEPSGWGGWCGSGG
jgi:hypothetical protein